MDAIANALEDRDVTNVDELHRGIESMPAAHYEVASYYERWLFTAEAILIEKGILAPHAYCSTVLSRLGCDSLEAGLRPCITGASRGQHLTP